MLFDNINEKATIAKAKKVLKNFPRLDRMAKASYSLGSSGHYQDIKAKGVRTQTAQHEKHLVKTLTAEQERDAIKQAVEFLDDPHRTILLKKYCHHPKPTNFVIYTAIGYGSARFYELHNEALLLFAEVYKGGELLTVSD